MTDQKSNNGNKAEDLFSNFGKKVDGFVDELNEAGDRLRKEFSERYEELKESAERLKKDAKDKKRWQEVESSLKQAGEELRKAFDAAFRRSKEK